MKKCPFCEREELQDVEEKTYKELAEKMQYKSNQELCDQICSVIRRVEGAEDEEYKGGERWH